MPTTRRQQAIQEGKIKDEPPVEKAAPASKGRVRKTSTASAGKGRKKTKHEEEMDVDESEVKKTAKKEGGEEEESKPEVGEKRDAPDVGTIERGHIYFFYRPRVQLEEAHSIDDIKNFHMLLLPRPPAFTDSSSSKSIKDANVDKADPEDIEREEMNVVSRGADAVPAPEPTEFKKKKYRLITVGKKHLPNPEHGGVGKGRKEMFWAIVTAVGDDLSSLEKGLGEKTYETKTRSTRHEAPARLVARGGYAIVNAPASTPSQRETHLGYHVSHPSPAELDPSSDNEVQTALGIFNASSFVIQVKNPSAPAMNPAQSHTKGPEYPQWIMEKVFGVGGARGRENYGLRFASCETPELLDYKGAQILLLAARDGETGLEASLGEGRGDALTEIELEESHESFQKVFEELGFDAEVFPAEALEGKWA
ncbi:hypothetical protein BDQ12DRAFT_613037 [Crucibulum laeve]|uniref:Uncharacterized protein n=1 Tax=Crucibulum laeve TaxID=68775 RepID=A0A5C3LR37_9AGAR|nr:hypothetical protein BDQ12DRAFT_613037 [Crucibulum laeve]